MKPGEGLAGSSGTARLDEIGPTDVSAANDLGVVYRFSGATDDGQQGSSSRREATSVLCTNIDDTGNAQVEVQIIQWNGTDIYTGTMNMPPKRLSPAEGTSSSAKVANSRDVVTIDQDIREETG
jgi:hypothetical protein